MVNSPVNMVYLIALAVCSLLLYVNSLFSALIFGVVTVAVFLVSISIVSMIEKVADKHVRFLMLALISSALVTLLKVVCSYVNVSIIVQTAENLEFASLPCMLLGIVPIYFENRYSVREFFSISLVSSAGYLLMIALFGAITEVLGYGAIAGFSIKGFDGLWFFTFAGGELMVIASLAIIFNIVRRAYIKKTKRFEMLVEKYKVQIREIRDTQVRVRAGERREYNE